MTPELKKRSNGHCELCNANTQLHLYSVSAPEPTSDSNIALCSTCKDQIEGTTDIDANHWRCLNDSMWSAIPAVQVAAWRQLKNLESELWAQDALEMLYLDDELMAWAKFGATNNDDSIQARDSNGAILQAGDNVVIIKDLDVKGTSFVAKRGTAVKGIALTDNPEHIEGRVNGTRIVLLTKFVKKS